MKTALYVQAHDMPWRAPGAGLAADGRLCSRCNRQSVSLGGGLIAGRWYCRACKPNRKTDMADLSKWTQALHAHCLRTGQGITPSEALAQFGVPPSNTSASAILNSALRTGWFRREEWREQGATGLVRRARYFAVAKADVPQRQPDNRQSYFTGLKRCRSVFELGSAS